MLLRVESSQRKTVRKKVWLQKNDSKIENKDECKVNLQKDSLKIRNKGGYEAKQEKEKTIQII